MSAGTPIQNFEKATTIPNGSLYLVEMGDGSGTKTVTQEILSKEMGEALKVGNLKELQTENKENLVAAINEAAQSGGGGASVDILDSKEEIEANTEAGKVAGALAVQEMFTELNDNLLFPDGVKFYPDVQNGVRGYNTDPNRGADTFCPFSADIKILSIASLGYNTNKTYSNPVYLHGQCSSNSIGNSVVYINNEEYINPVFESRKLPSGTTIRGRGTSGGVYSVYMIEVSK